MLDLLRQELEKAIQERKTGAARALIKRLLDSSRHASEIRVLASESYRRLSDFQSALRVLDSEEALNAFPPQVRSRAKLQLARMLNLLGASGYALRIVRSLSDTERRAHPDAVAGIFVSNYCYSETLAALLGAEPGKTYAERLRSVTMADALFGDGRSQEAMSLLERTLSMTHEPLLIGIASQAMGSYQLMLGQSKEARRSLAAAERSFGPHDRTLDRGYLDKWLGAYQALHGKRSQAIAHLTRSWRALYRPGFKPEAWLEVLYWQGLLNRGSLPAEWALILAYPSPTVSRAARWIAKRTNRPDVLRFGAGAGQHCVDFESAMLLGPDRREYGLNLPEQLIGNLVIAGRYGIPLFRACEALWPNELFSFQHNLKRVEQLILRARTRDFDLSWKNLHLASRRNPGWSCLWSAHPPRPGLRFLRERTSFSREEVEAYFGVSKRMALNICEQWVGSGIAEIKGKARAAKYITRRVDN